MLSKEEIIREEKEKISCLHNKTGRGVFQCRKALSVNEWNVDKTIKWLNQFGDSHFYLGLKEEVKETEEQTNETEQIVNIIAKHIIKCAEELHEIMR